MLDWTGKKHNGRLWLPIVVFLAMAASAGEVERIPTEHFAALPDFTNVRLSPDGSRVAAVANVVHDDFTGKIVLQQDLSSGEQKLLASLADGRFKLNWIRWANDRQLLVSFRTREAVFGTPVTSTRLMVVDADTGDSTSAIPAHALRRAEWIPQFQDRVVDLVDEDDEHILMQADLRSQNAPDVYRINLNSGKMRSIERGKKGTRRWITDRQHRVRLSVWQDETEIRVYEQDIDGRNKRILWEYEALSEDVVYPLGFAADPNVLYVRAYHDGRLAVFRVDLSDPGLEKELIYADDYVDVSGRLVYSPRKEDVVGIRTGRGGEYAFWSDEHKRIVRSVNAALPEHHNGIVSFSRDEERIAFFSESDTNAGTYYVLDTSEMAMRPFARRYKYLFPELMAEKSVIEYEARDGTPIQAFLTLPRGSDGTGLPAIVYPHGGPVSFDSDGFDYWTQLFANRGYAVMQMNFRGSAGYGYDFMAAGFQSWGLKMQDDVADATQWLIDNGIADPDRICIVGGSYGGYAALMGVAKTPDLYRCAVSFAGVTDLVGLLAASRRYVNSEVDEIQLGTKRRDLKDRSPISFAADIEAPVLLIHGEHDNVVRVNQSRRMARALERLEKDVTYIEQPDGDHYLSTNEQRLEALLAIEDFLAKHLD